MSNSFFLILKKSIQVVRKDPIIFIPHLMFGLFMVVAGQLEFFSNYFLIIQSVCEWLIFSLIIQPIVILISWSNIQNKSLNFSLVLAKLMSAMGGLFFVSLHKPMVIFAGNHLITIAAGDSSPDAIGLNYNGFLVFLLLVGFFISILTIYFQSFYLTQPLTRHFTFRASLLSSVKLFIRFKWVSMSFLLYLFLVMSMLMLVSMGALSAVFPSHYHAIIIQMVHGVLKTIYIVALFRFFLVIKPMAQLEVK
jgi:hypothetical protein